MFTFIDLFAGGGGFSRGFVEAGFKPVLAIENFPPAIETYSRNFPEAVLLGTDIQEIHTVEILRILQGRGVDVIIGGPPCEAYTRANPQRRRDPLERLYEDPRGRLVLHFIRIVGDLKPRIFVMENVPGIMDGGLDEVIREEFARVGYDDVYFNILRAEEYGTPSHRVRVFVSNVKLKPRRRPKRTVIDAIGDLPPPDPYYGVPNHEYVPLSRKKRKRVAKLRWGEALTHYRGYGGRVLGNYVRLHPYRVAPTVMGSARFIHPFEDRVITVREQARLMGFPDDHVFYGGRDAQYNQVGEAVPPPLARAIGEYVYGLLSGGL